MIPGLTEHHAIEELKARFNSPTPDPTVAKFSETERAQISRRLLQLQGLDGNNAIPSHKQSAFYEAVRQFVRGEIKLEEYRVKIKAILGDQIN